MIIRQLLSLNFRGIKRVLTCVRSAATSMEHGKGGSTLCSDGLVWIDLELTGLDLEKDRIMEVACVVTDKDLNAISGSGLTEACRKSHLTLKEAEDQLCSYVGGLVTPGQCPLAGSTVYMDRRFLQRDMPRLDSLLHYRIVDVSTVKELARRWFREEYYQALRLKTASHRAMPDILESIKELKFYRNKIFIAKESSSPSKVEVNMSI
ncbi:oligoribonuclease, mitochondrial isoform X3 [Rhipicephalus microplus]|uniref:oligoribonuclease, mitochondrial isoform X3 n=1 Tax=Rhipicephalus microplus TaxID=6941 RepID=UPI003F6CD20B